MQMLGLWYIMGASFLFAIFAVLASHISWATGTNARVQKTASKLYSRTVSVSGGYWPHFFAISLPFLSHFSPISFPFLLTWRGCRVG